MANPAEVQPPRIGARYQVLEQLGRGGMAVVYRVRDTSRGEELALKQLVVPDDPARARELTALFEREFYTLAQLSHPGVVEAYDFGLDPGGPYYTMELLDGGDLSGAAPLSPREACRLLAMVCSSLSLLHSRRLVHRDISPRNIRLTRDGRAKLIDFGALLDMGPCPQTVGTPAYVAPEVVQRVGLDARTDLFSLGATLYFALTGRTPFGVRAFAELRNAWRAEVVPPSRLVAHVPPALDQLVLSLLRIDPNLRPNSAFEVMQRLSAVAGIEQPESEQVAQAYLTTPRLVGREAQLRKFRSHLRKALAGQGSALAFEAAPGIGRSRLLDACVLEAKTTGATTLRMAGGASAAVPFAGVRALAGELFEALPEVAGRAALAAGVAELLRTPAGELVPVEVLQADRPRSFAGVIAWIEAVCREHRLLIAADDADRLDEASMALLAALANGASGRRSLIVITLSAELTAAPPPAFGVLRSQCTTVTLSALSPEQTLLLFTSVFGNTPNVAGLSARIHPLAGGSPREALALADQLFDKQLIRYAEGQWILPAELTLQDLPASLDDALRVRIAELPQLALRLAQTQALALGGPWLRADYAELASDEGSRIDAALAALLKSGLLTTDGTSYSVAQPAYRDALIQQLPAAETSHRHLELARFIARAGRPPVFEVHHLLLGGEIERGLDRLAELLEADGDRSDLYERPGVDQYEIAESLALAHELALTTQRRPRELHEIERLLTALSVVTHAQYHRRYAPAWLARLELDSGLADYRALAHLPPDSRLMAALQRASERYEATPVAARVYRVDEAIKYLVRYVVVSIVVGVRIQDLRLLSSTPGLLEPLAGLSPLLEAIWQNAIAANEVLYQNRTDRAHSRLMDVYEKLSGVTGQELRYLFEIRRAHEYAIGMIEMTMGLPTLPRWLEVLDRNLRQRADAMYIRSLDCVYRGDFRAAESYRRQSDVLAVQASSNHVFGPMVNAELVAHASARDLPGVRRVAERAAELAAEEPAWSAVAAVAQGWYQQLRGDARAACAAFERSFEVNDPHRTDPPPCYFSWGFGTAGYIEALVDLGRAAEARDLGIAAVAFARANELAFAKVIETAVALAESALGQHAAAAARLDALIAKKTRDVDRITYAYEARARVAVAAGDAANAANFAYLAMRGGPEGHEFDPQPRHARLLDEAKRAGIDLKHAPSGFETKVLGAHPARMAIPLEAVGGLPALAPAERPHRMLELLCEVAEGPAGQLYRCDAETLALVASRGDIVEPGLPEFAARYLALQREQAMYSDVLTEHSDSYSEGPELGRWTGPSGSTYRMLPLTCSRGEELHFTGLLVLKLPANQRVRPRLQVLARALAPYLGQSML